MKIHLSIIALAMFIFTSCEEAKIEIGQATIIPQPLKIDVASDHFLITKNTKIAVENATQEIIAKQFAKTFEHASGWSPDVQIATEGNIVMITDETLAEEGYKIEPNSTKNGIIIKAKSEAGFFYATQTLLQMLPASFYSEERLDNVEWGIPMTTIEDQPAFGWRGYMLDVSRHFFSVEEVKKVLDMMATLKMNRFHWHLTDDQGWRLEIKSYPKLTEVGAWRMDHTNLDESKSDWWGRPAQQPGDKATYGGFYTQEEVKEIVAYAKERYIEVIPEIEMPGHAQAAMAAYPELACVDAYKYVATGGVAKNNTYNPGKEETFQFVQGVLDEVVALFPFEYVHIGGDECNKSQWKVDPYAQQRIKDEGLKDEYELQSYFIKRVENILNERDRILIGWDEILEGGLAPNATVMSWRGEKGGIASAKAGHEVIMTPSKYCYLDLKQGHDDMEPNLGYSYSFLSDAYNYKVIPEALNEEEGKFIKGIQANMWSESISDWGKFTYMSYPRVLAVAESAWSPESNKDWSGFTHRLETYFEKLDAQNIRYAVSAFSPWIDHIGDGEGIDISMKTEVDDLDIYYTLDGSDPNINSNKYTGIVRLTESAELSAHSYRGKKAVGYTSRLPFQIHKAGGLTSKKEGQEKLTDLSYAKLHISDKNWKKYTNEAVIDLSFDKPERIESISFDALRYTITGVYIPHTVEVSGSLDGNDYTILGKVDQMDIGTEQGRNKVKTVIKFDSVEIKDIRINCKTFDTVPEGHHTAGKRASMRIDEIVVN